MSSSQARQKWRDKRTAVVEDWARENYLMLEYLNDGYQLRIQSILDIYPTSGRWHILKTGDRGDWNTSKALLNSIYTRAFKDSGLEYPEHANNDFSVNFDFGDDITVPEHDVYRLEHPHDKIKPRKWWQFWRKR